MDVFKIIFGPLVNVILKTIDWILPFSKTKKGRVDKLISNLSIDDNERVETTTPFHYRGCPIDFVGREKELTQLEKFVEHQRPALWWAISGKPGVGKSRMAYEFLKKLEPKKWDYKIISGKQFSTIPVDKSTNLRLKKNLFIVVDDIYLYRHQLGETLSVLMSNYQGKHKLRILVLERVYSDDCEITHCPEWENKILIGSDDDVSLCSFKFKPYNLCLKANLNVSQIEQIIRNAFKSKHAELTEKDKTIILNRLEIMGFERNDILALIHCCYEYLNDSNTDCIALTVQHELLRLQRTFDTNTFEERNTLYHIVCVLCIVGEMPLDTGILDEILEGFHKPCLRRSVVKRIVGSGCCEQKHASKRMLYILPRFIPDCCSSHFVRDFLCKMDAETLDMFLGRIQKYYPEKIATFVERYIELNAFEMNPNDEKIRIFFKYIYRNDRTLPIHCLDYDGNMIDGGLLYHYICSYNNKHYIVLTNNEIEDGYYKVLAFIFIPSDPHRIVHIETDVEWKIVEIILEEIETKENLDFIEVYEQCNPCIEARVKQLFL